MNKIGAAHAHDVLPQIFVVIGILIVLTFLVEGWSLKRLLGLATGYTLGLILVLIDALNSPPK